MALISDVDEYGFKRSEEEIKFLAESEHHFKKITQNQMEWNNFTNSTIRNSVFLRNYSLKRFIRKGKLITNESFVIIMTHCVFTFLT